MLKERSMVLLELRLTETTKGYGKTSLRKRLAWVGIFQAEVLDGGDHEKEWLSYGINEDKRPWDWWGSQREGDGGAVQDVNGEGEAEASPTDFCPKVTLSSKWNVIGSHHLNLQLLQVVAER